jgi:perosamine synthetase
MYSILIDNRDAMIEKLKTEEIDSRPFFPPVHQQPPYKRRDKYPVAEDLSLRGLNLPSSVTLKDADIEKIAATILKSL